MAKRKPVLVKVRQKAVLQLEVMEAIKRDSKKYLRDCKKRGGVDDIAHGHIVRMVAAGIKVKKIAKEMNVSVGTIYYTCRKPPPSDRPKKKPPQLTLAQRKKIERRRKLVTALALAVRRQARGVEPAYPTICAVRRAVNRKMMHDYCRKTIQDDLSFLGFSSYIRPMKPIAHKIDPVMRLRLAKHYLRALKSEHFKRICFSDEKYWDCNHHGPARMLALRREDVTCRQKSTWSPRVHVWGVIGIGIRFLVFLPCRQPGTDDPVAKMNSEMYVELCLKPFRKYIEQLRKEGKLTHTPIFQQDGLSAHWSAMTKAFLYATFPANRMGEKEFGDLVILSTLVNAKWPANSPDLSPIENVWAVIQRRVDAHGPDMNGSSDAELRALIQKEWDAISDEELRNYVSSYERRLQMCVARNGGNTKY